MKKVLLTGSALLAFAAAGFAQNNTATLLQNGTSQSASQYQSGNYLKSTITQDKGSGSNAGSYAGTNQTSTGTAGNEAIIDQKTNANSNRAFVAQEIGTGNKGTITQSDNSGGGSLHVGSGTSAADVKAAGGNWAGILQQGSNNKNTYVNQGKSASRNFGEIYQYGSGNRQTSIDQSDNSNGNTATVNQGTASASISNGRVVVSQQGNSRNNEAFVTQLASGNDAVVTQKGGNIAGSDNNKATVSQTDGSGSSATIEQQNYSTTNAATITQQRGGNTGFVKQSDASGYNTADIMQRGFGGMATIKQTDYAANGTAAIDQNGFSNMATIEQVNANSSGNRASIKQDLSSTAGFSNVAEIKQGELGAGTSAANAASIVQNYSQNSARLLQVGISNTGTLTQTGDFNIIRAGDGTADSFAMQRGDNNTMTVTQDSGASAPYVRNTANVSQIGNGNMANIVQLGHN
ncbi:hypothetical protein GCM10027578_40510 [Spirosoma luteolum]